MRNYIPTINISSLLKSDFNTLTAKNTIKKIEKACVNVGLFQIVGHGINKEKINNIWPLHDSLVLRCTHITQEIYAYNLLSF